MFEMTIALPLIVFHTFEMCLIINLDKLTLAAIFALMFKPKKRILIIK